MRHLIGIGIKLLTIMTILLSIFAVLSRDYIDIMFLTGLVLVVTSYLIGDLWIVPRFGNVAGTIADFGLALILILGVGFITMNFNFLFLVTAISAAFLIAAGEAFFHYYVEMVLNKGRKDIYEDPSSLSNQLNTKLQTEYSEEISPEKKE